MSGNLHFTGRVRGALRSLVPAGLKIAHSHDELPPIERDGLVARCHRNWPDDPNFIPRYRELVAKTPAATVFNSPVWQAAVVNEFVPAGHFRLITVSRDSQLLAVVPLAMNTASMLETPGKWLTDYLDPPVDTGAFDQSWTLILNLLQSLWDWSIGGVHFHHVRGDSAMRKLLPDLAAECGFDYSESPMSANPYITLPKTWDEFLDSLPGHDRKEIKRKLRNAQAKANLQWNTLTTEETAIPALERAMSAMRQSESLKADFTDEILVGFLRRICPVLTRQGDFYVQELSLENEPTAWLLCLRSPRGPMIYNTAYSFAKKHLSPGIVCFSMAIQDAIAAGAPVFNLLRGAEEYKKRLGAKDLDLFRIELLPR
jgi:hypothetical protein